MDKKVTAIGQISWEEAENSHLRQNDDFGDFVRVVKEVSQLMNEAVSYREKSALSQRDMAKRLELKQPAVARMESLRSIPRLDTFIRYLNALQLTIKVIPCDISDEE